MATLIDSYLRSHGREAIQRYGQDFGRVVRQFWPQAFPNLPVSAAFGFASNGGLESDTAEAAPDRRAPFHELGAFGITAGPWNVPAPNRDASVENQWLSLHNDPLVRRMLGRDACMTAECWRPSRGGLADSTAVGIATLVRHLAGTANRLRADLRPRGPSAWEVALLSWGWSAGDGRAAGFINRYADRLAPLDDAARFNALGVMLAQDAVNGQLTPTTAGSHANPAHGWIRTRQKLAVAQALDAHLGQNAGYYTQGASPAELAWAEQVLSEASRGRDVTGMGFTGASVGGGVLGVVVGVGVGLGALVALRRALRG